eukprot:4588196-Amphidinium_carterae.1
MYNFAYLTRQDCRKLKKKVKKRSTGFAAAVTMDTGPAAAPPPGGDTGRATALPQLLAHLPA